MASAPPTVLSLKQSFLTAQTRLLSQPLAPTRAWRNANDNKQNEPSDDSPAALPEKAVDDALFKLNHRLQQHSRRVYAPQATRHVAEQIDQLYWNAADAALEDDDDAEDEATAEALNLGADLANPAVITTLPLTWDSQGENPKLPAQQNNPQEESRYAALAADLHALAERKQAAAARVARLRQMRTLLAPFSPSPSPFPSSHPPTTSTSSGTTAAASTSTGDGNGNPGACVQENLVTRNGEVEAELARMRMLLARVGGRVGRLKEQKGKSKSSGGGDDVGELRGESMDLERGGGGVDEMEGVEVDERRKVGLLLERF